MKLLSLALLLVLGLALHGTCMTINQDVTLNLQAKSSWTSLGCYTDNVYGRALLQWVIPPGGTNAMTNALCQSGCLGLGFSIAGTEYAGECWCGNSIINGGSPAPDGNTGCNMKCKGDSSDICGGPNRLDVYQYNAPASLTSATAASSRVTHATQSTQATQATHPTPTSSTSPTSPAASGKRGIAYSTGNTFGNATYANFFKGNSKVTWGYDWGYPSHGLDSSFEFVPMLWGLPSATDPSWMEFVENYNPAYILGFNEPDLTYSSSSNILPENAALGYQTYMEPFSGNMKIGMPNVLWNNVGSSSGGKYDSAVWDDYFVGNCTHCELDFMAIHYYQDCDPADGQSGAAWFQGNVTSAHQAFNLPVWITEFQCYGTDAQQIAFLQEVLPWMDQQEYVQRYAYFGAFPNNLVNTAGTGLSDLGVAYATT